MATALIDTLRAIVGEAHVLAGVELSPYAIEGRTPEAAVFPGSIDEVRAVVKAAGEAAMPLTAWGGGTAMAVGVPPVRAGIVLGLRRLDALLEHEPGDLTVTVQAGLTVERLQAALRARGQWLSLDPADAGRATLGGVVAANASGPRRQLYGTARDLLIGVTVVTADGELVRGGGKVVKNVAGYDLPKLFIGSYGTLGIIVELTFKLRPLPDAERLVAIRFERLKDAGLAVRAILDSDLIPNALELRDGPASRGLDLDDHPAALCIGFDGLHEQIDWQCAQLGPLVAAHGGGAPMPLPEPAWSRLHAAAPGGLAPAAVVRATVLPSHVAEAMEQGAAVARAHGFTAAWSAHAGVGTLTGALLTGEAAPSPKSVASVVGEWRAIARAAAGSATLAWAPLAVKAEVPVWDDLGAAGRVMQRIKSQLDPQNLLNPGRFVAGI